jgi:branched-chain amino acid transport system ATP-binding protein
VTDASPSTAGDQAPGGLATGAGSGPLASGDLGGTTATAAGDIALELRDVRAAYGRIQVVHGVDLVVPVGSVLALLGPNGAGKSTLLKVAGGRMRPTSGVVIVGGREVSRAGADAMVHSGVCSIPEGRGVFPNLTVRENLLMWTYQGPIDRGTAEDRAYSRFPKLSERRKQLAGTLSGGEQQMLAFARALVGDPKVLLLDEISMGLAPLVVSELYDVVGTLAGEGITILLVEQFVQTAIGVADRAALMVHGRIVCEGSPEEVGAQAAAAYLGGTGD